MRHRSEKGEPLSKDRIELQHQHENENKDYAQPQPAIHEGHQKQVGELQGEDNLPDKIVGGLRPHPIEIHKVVDHRKEGPVEPAPPLGQKLLEGGGGVGPGHGLLDVSQPLNWEDKS